MKWRRLMITSKAQEALWYGKGIGLGKRGLDVRFRSKADIVSRQPNVRFTLSEASTMTFRVEQCKKLRHHKCVRYKLVKGKVTNSKARR